MSKQQTQHRDILNNALFKSYWMLTAGSHSWLEVLMLSPGCLTLLIPVRNLSIPLRTIVSEYPLSVLHTEHAFVRASVPLYQPFTQCSHPSRLLQHLVKIRGVSYVPVSKVSV